MLIAANEAGVFGFFSADVAFHRDFPLTAPPTTERRKWTSCFTLASTRRTNGPRGPHWRRVWGISATPEPPP